jgi:hypothetical protein
MSDSSDIIHDENDSICSKGGPSKQALKWAKKKEHKKVLVVSKTFITALLFCVLLYILYSIHSRTSKNKIQHVVSE